MGRRQLLVRPARALLATLARHRRRVERQRIVIAEYGPGLLLLHQGHDPVHHRGRIGAIADQVPEQREAIGTPIPGMGQAGVQCLEVGMDVGQQGELHRLAS